MVNYAFTHFSDSSEDDSVVVLQTKSYGYDASRVCEHKTEKSESRIQVENFHSNKFISEVFSTLSGNVAKVPSLNFYNYYSNNFSEVLNNPTRSLSDNFTKPPLPICVRYQSNRCVVVERPPFRIPVRMSYRHSRSRRRKKKDDNAKNNYEFEIWIPWSILVIVFNDSYALRKGEIKSYLFFRDSPVTSFDDLLTIAYTPNIYGDGSMCMGESSDRLYNLLNTDQISADNISQIYQYIINEYFSGGWNLDLNLTNFSSFDKLFNKKNMKDVFQKAEEFNNKFILSFKEDYSTFSISSFVAETRIKFFFNYLSMLNLEETLDVLRTIEKSYQNDKYDSNHCRSLKEILTLCDTSFSMDYSNLDEEASTDIYELITRSEERRSSEIVRSSISSSQNVYSLHRWSIKFSYNVDDFLSFASRCILSNNNLFLGTYSRECFYKKNIKYFIFELEHLLNYVFTEYVRQIHSKYDVLILELFKNSILELSDYYRYEYKSQVDNISYKKVLTIDLSQYNFTLEEFPSKVEESINS